jgi:transcriptional regulator with XRE-family HTH domain
VEPDLEEWGRRIMRFRKFKGLSQEQLALELSARLGRDIPQSLVSRYERGKRPPPESVRIALARILDAPIAVLFPYPDDVR